MTWDQARDLSHDPLVTIGAHTRTHPILSRLDPDRLQEEVLGGKVDIESRLGLPVTEFAYPNGRRIDIDDRSIALVRNAFRTAVTTVSGLNPAGQDRFLLKRIGIGNADSDRRFRALASGIYGE
jgi:peptidoglycan/xylan/chitin deacetylase (PgdA/CDA1 family)